MATRSDALVKDQIVFAVLSKLIGEQVRVSFGALLKAVNADGPIISDAGLKKSLKRLVAAGAVGVQKHGRGNPSTYTFDRAKAEAYLQPSPSIDSIRHDDEQLSGLGLLRSDATIDIHALGQVWAGFSDAVYAVAMQEAMKAKERGENPSVDVEEVLDRLSRVNFKALRRNNR